MAGRYARLCLRSSRNACSSAAANAPGIGFELLLDARRHIGIAGDKGVDHRGRGRRALYRRLAQFAAQIEVIGAALAHRDARAGLVDLLIGLQR